MEIERWRPKQELGEQEERIIERRKRTGKLFAFLRRHRHELFDEAFQAELETMYRQTGAGKEPLPPALMAMATLLQGYLSASDATMVELTVFDLRVQMVLDCLGHSEPAFSQGALCDFRHRLIRSNMDRRLLEKSVEVAMGQREFGWRALKSSLRVAIDSRPLEGAGRVEDTFNLLGHAALVETVLQQKGEVLCKPWATQNGELLPKSAFKLDMRSRTVTCPGGQRLPFTPGAVVEFEAKVCGQCPLRTECTTAQPEHGRMVRIAEDEALQQRLHKLVKSPTGRARLRERVKVEHRLAHLSRRQGRRARYRGVRKNMFDLRRAAALQNIEPWQRHLESPRAQAPQETAVLSNRSVL